MNDQKNNTLINSERSSSIVVSFQLKKHLIHFLLLLACSINAQPSLTIDWHYKEPSARGRFIRHDHQNNIITVGAQGTNIFGTYVDLYIVKHDTLGNMLWSQTLSDNNGGLFRPKDMFIDSNDNIYIIGRAHYNSTFAEGFVLKYNNQGNLQWNQYFGAAQGLVGEINAITLFNEQFLYIAGTMDSLSGSGVRKSILLKYDINGNLLWANSDTVNYNKEGVSAEVDKNGNAYLIGFTSCCLPGGDMFVEKYDSSGNRKWETVILDSNYQYGNPRKSAIDDSANVYIIGSIDGLNVPTGFDCGTVKMDSSGILKWYKPFHSISSSVAQDIPTGIIVDKSNNLYVFGISMGNSSDHGFLIKYDPRGNQKWAKLGNDTTGNYWYRISNCELINDTIIILGGNGGQPQISNAGNAVTLAIDSSGVIIWSLGQPYYGSFYDFCFLNHSSYFTGLLFDSNYIMDDSLFTVKLNYNTGVGFGFGNVAPEIKINLFPCPVTNEVNLILEGNPNSIADLNIYNSLGIKIYSNSFNKPSIRLDVLSLSTGMYFIEINIGNEIIRKKFLKYANR